MHSQVVIHHQIRMCSCLILPCYSSKCPPSPPLNFLKLNDIFFFQNGGLYISEWLNYQLSWSAISAYYFILIIAILFTADPLLLSLAFLASTCRNCVISSHWLYCSYAVFLIEKKDHEGQSHVLSAVLEVFLDLSWSNFTDVSLWIHFLIACHLLFFFNSCISTHLV